MKLKKITSIIAIALTVVTANVTVGDAVYAAEISSSSVSAKTNNEIKLKSKVDTKFVNIVESNTKFTKGHYSFNKDNAIKSGLSSDNANLIAKLADEFNNEIDNGTITVSSDGRKIVNVKSNENLKTTSNTIRAASIDVENDSRYQCVYNNKISPDTCNTMGDLLGYGAGTFTIASYMFAKFPWGSKACGYAAGAMQISSVYWYKAAREGGADFKIYELRSNSDIYKCFLR